MEWHPLLLIAAGVALLVLWLVWTMTIGPIRGSLAILARIGWTLPLFLSFFPRAIPVTLPNTIQAQSISVLIDDSNSMEQSHGALSSSPKSKTQEVLQSMEQGCRQFSCQIKVSLLSELDPDTKAGLTPLSRVLESWLFKVGTDPWMLITDGGDFQPKTPWDASLAGLGQFTAGGDRGHRGLILGFDHPDQINLWVSSVDAPSFAFEAKPLDINVTIKRARPSLPSERVQIQALLEDKALATVNAEFAPGDQEIIISLTVPALSRGQHLLALKVLPVDGEGVLWDNEQETHIEVMANTVGVLHLLGSPSWDGRFLRRYLKSEPKYDLISFFILRDPWDQSQVNERELSLIPFPVERLFNEELPNFRVLILQDFTLLQFLLPEYQQNLVQFVKDGGGLFFIGGRRALMGDDLKNSPLKEILPFELIGEDKGAPNEDPWPFAGGPFDNRRGSKTGPWFDENLKFGIELAQPTMEQRGLANFYDEWELMADGLAAFDSAAGLHRMENVKFLDGSYTPLLNAVASDGVRRPLAVASYPGKGRAVWLFSDTIWRMGMLNRPEIPREIYNRLMHSAMTWLLREDLKKPLFAHHFQIEDKGDQDPRWRVLLRGPAARYFQLNESWQISLCGEPMSHQEISIERTGVEEWTLMGRLPVKLNGGTLCRFTISGTHSAFGSVSTSLSTTYPQIFTDDEILAAPNKLEELANLTGAGLSLVVANHDKDALTWIETLSGQHGIPLPDRHKVQQHFYWILDQWYAWLLFLLMPAEIFIRRWDKIFASGGTAYKRAWSRPGRKS